MGNLALTNKKSLHESQGLTASLTCAVRERCDSDTACLDNGGIPGAPTCGTTLGVQLPSPFTLCAAISFSAPGDSLLLALMITRLVHSRLFFS